MGNSGGKNRTHPREEEDFGSSPALVEGRHGYNYDYDQHRDYDSGVRMNKIPSKYYSYIFFYNSVASEQNLRGVLPI